MKEDAKEAINLPIRKDDFSQKRRVGLAVTATQVEEIKSADWTELDMPETLWKYSVKEFGPLIVSIDAHRTTFLSKIRLNLTRKRMRHWLKFYRRLGL